jgi:2-polyprenyl-3-methyl-5-hydroxy-6-metoxy-1,4-benzoquinol methylase
LSSDTKSKCIFCGETTRIRSLFKLSRPIQQCVECGLVYAEPSGAAVHREYTESYYKQGVYANYLEDRPAIHKNAQRSLARLEQLTEGRELLDVGCAAGFFLAAARDRGWTVRGLEVSEYASEYARVALKLPVTTGSIVSPPESLTRFDVVTLWDTIEHLDRPDLALANIHRVLNPRGVFVFSTGDYGSLLRRLTGKRWRLFADPTHNFFFDLKTLKGLLRRAGFEILTVSRCGKWVSLSMILHQSPLPFAAVLRRWLSARGYNPALYVNLWDVVTVFARQVRSGGDSLEPPRRVNET